MKNVVDADIVVVGAGHAGVEAALASARLGMKTVLVSQNFEAVARMSCNPAIGGLAKGNMVREIDALGGEMGKLADSAMLQFRILNKSRGSAVQAPRAQEDKFQYSKNAHDVIFAQKNLTCVEDTVIDFITEKRKITGVKLKEKGDICSRAVVLTTGTFMEGKTFTGDIVKEEGRIGEPAAKGLGVAMRRLGFNMGRLKTGTPARIIRSSIDYGKCEIQKGDDVIIPFSFMNGTITDRKIIDSQEPCYVTFTNKDTHKIISDNIHRSPLFSGLIVGKGPRYCPSIEDKVVRFKERERHQLFIEPEGRNSKTMYLNGLSSSLPVDVQDAFLRTVPGLEKAEVDRYAYAVEYDYSDPQDLFPSLESKIYENLFIAGQTNGTSGYEEAAGQGLIAGINAVLKLEKEKPLILKRDEAYIGVLIDDLITKGTKEPYRMFTSRAEYRLNLRHDTADRRLTEYALKIKLADEERKEKFSNKLLKLKEITDILKKEKTDGHTAFELLKKSDADTADLIRKIAPLAAYDFADIDTVAGDIKYSGYLKRQETSIKFFHRLEKVKISADFNYRKVAGLSAESLEKLEKVRPLTLRQAGEISGVRQSDLALLSLYLSGKIKL